jgi:hypothetical protein
MNEFGKNDIADEGVRRWSRAVRRSQRRPSRLARALGRSAAAFHTTVKMAYTSA